MSATANPLFDKQKQVIDSLRRVHRVCIGLEAAQVGVQALALVLFYYNSHATHVLSFGLKLYTVMFCFFAAIFAHVVVLYVLVAVEKNIKSAYTATPSQINPWLINATSRQKLHAIPFFVVHGITLLLLLAFAAHYPSTEHAFNAHSWVIWTALAAGAASFARVFTLLKQNVRYLTVFVTSGGYPERMVDRTKQF